MAALTFPNGKTVDLPIDLTRLWVPNEEAVPHILRICGFQTGTDIEKADKFFELLEKIGPEKMVEKIYARDSIFLEAAKEGMSISDDFDFNSL